MIDVNEVVALVGATTEPNTDLVARELAAHKNIVERPTPDVKQDLEAPKHDHIVVDIDKWTMDDYIGLMDLQDLKNPKDVILGMRNLLLTVVKDWNFVDDNGVKIPISLEGFGKLKPREWREVSEFVMKIAQTSFLS